MGAKQGKPKDKETVIPAQSKENLLTCKSAQTSVILPTDGLLEEAAQSGFLPDNQIAWIIDDLLQEPGS